MGLIHDAYGASGMCVLNDTSCGLRCTQFSSLMRHAVRVYCVAPECIVGLAHGRTHVRWRAHNLVILCEVGYKRGITCGRRRAHNGFLSL